MKNKKSFIFIIILLLIFIFFWFQLRPMLIIRECNNLANRSAKNLSEITEGLIKDGLKSQGYISEELVKSRYSKCLREYGMDK